MATRNTLSTRWVTLIMVAALVCSVAVVWGLIQITGESPASSSTAPASESASQSAADPGTDVSSSDRTTTTAAETNSLRPSAGSAVSTALTPAPILPGSAVRLPAAWTGTAEMSISVLGRCATSGGTSSYTRSAELALQGPVVGNGAFDDPNPLSMTLGITPAGIPGLAIYSASTDRSGEVHRTWWLSSGTDQAAPERTTLSGVLIDDQPVAGALPPNLLVDNETDLQPCESGGTVRVPRTLAAGSRVTGWVSATEAHLDVTATTTDGERAVTAVVTLSRRPGA